MGKKQKESKHDVYMPLIIGDWLKGTRGMKAEVRGVYIGLLLHQWCNGFIPSDMDELCLIDPELPKVWAKLRDKFTEVSPGQLQNKNSEEVREFFLKQRKNGKNGGRPKKENPKRNPNNNPEANPNPNLHNEYEFESDSLKNKKEFVQDFSGPANPWGGEMGDVQTNDEKVEYALAYGLGEAYLEQQQPKWPGIDFAFEYRTFCEKVRGSPSDYTDHDTAGIRKAFQYQLREAMTKRKTRNGNHQTKQQRNITDLAEGFAKRYGNKPSPDTSGYSPF